MRRRPAPTAAMAARVGFYGALGGVAARMTDGVTDPRQLLILALVVTVLAGLLWYLVETVLVTWHSPES